MELKLSRVTHSKRGFLAVSLMLIAVLIASVSAAMYMEFSRAMIREASENNRRKLAQLHNSLVLSVQYVNDSINYISYDADLRDYIAYAESMDLIRLYRIKQRIEALVNFHEGMDAIHVYFKNDRKVLSFFRGLVDEEDFFDQEALIYSEDFFLKPGWSKPRTIRDDRFIYYNLRKGITILRPYEGNLASSSDVFLIVDLNWRYIESMTESYGFGDGNPVVYRSPEGERIPLVPLEEGFLERADPKEYLILTQSTSFGGDFVSYIRKADLTADVRRMMTVVIVLSVLAMAVGVSMFLFISAPILNAFDGLSLLFHSRDLDEVIKNAHDLLVEKERTDRKLLEGAPRKSAASLMGIFDQSTEEADIRRLLADQGVDFDFHFPFACAVFESLAPQSDGGPSWTDGISSAIKGLYPTSLCFYSGYGQLVCLAPSPGADDMPKRLRSLLAESSQGMRGPIVCGLAFSRGGFAAAAGCFSQARNALRYRFQRPGETVFLYDDAADASPEAYGILEHLPALPRGVHDHPRLIGHRRSLGLFLGSLEAGPYLHPEIIKSMLLRILQNMSESAPPALDRNIDSAIVNLFSAPDLGKASKILLDYCDALVDAAASDPQDDPGSLIVEKAKSFIAANLDKDLSVQRIGEEVFMSRSHLSRLFFMKTGVLLRDYILERRMDAACRYLRDHSLQIQDVGKSVGYPNTQSFIRSFKEKVGCTPGEYRRKLPLGA